MGDDLMVGVRGRPPKPEPIRQGHRRRNLTALAPREDRRPLRVPPGLSAVAGRVWRAYWRSPVSRAAEVGADYHVLVRWIRALDEYETTAAVVRERRIVKGSMGQPVINPLVGYLRDLEETIRYAEQQLGLTPVARIRLGIALGEARLTADELNRRLDQAQARARKQEPGAKPEGAEGAVPNEQESWEGEWEQA